MHSTSTHKSVCRHSKPQKCRHNTPSVTNIAMGLVFFYVDACIQKDAFMLQTITKFHTIRKAISTIARILISFLGLGWKLQKFLNFDACEFRYRHTWIQDVSMAFVSLVYRKSESMLCLAVCPNSKGCCYVLWTWIHFLYVPQMKP